MLKFKKSLKTNDVTICLRERENFFNQTFCTAFSIALAIHLGAFILFHIEPFKMTSSFLFSPVTVNVNIPKEEEISLEQLPTLKDASSNSFIPPSPIPSLPSVPHSLSEQASFTAIRSIEIPSFSSIESLEKRSYTPSISNLPYSPIRFSISGQLAQQKIAKESSAFINHVLNTRWIKGIEPLSYFYMKYLVQIDPQSGVLFWLDKIHSSGSLEIDQLAEQLLLKLRFEPSLTWDNLKGEIDLIITLDKNKKGEDLMEMINSSLMQ